MQTTIDIDEDVFLAVNAIAHEQNLSPRRVLSDLVRQALLQSEILTRNGVPLFPYKAEVKPVTLDLVNQLRDEMS